MLDGIETDRAAVDDACLIKRLDIHVPFSPTDGEVCYDRPLVPAEYKGMHIYGKPRGKLCEVIELTQYWFRLRGSIIRVANNGLHNHDAKDPFEILYALDDLITSLRVDPFRTPLNGLELSVTIGASNTKQVCSNLLSYLNHSPNVSTIDPDEIQRPYAEVKVKQHRLKVYETVVGSLRVEVKVDKMQYLGNSHPRTFADLVQPRYAASLVNKLLGAFNKIIWKCHDLDLNSLTPAERELYLLGRVHEYWQVHRKDTPPTMSSKLLRSSEAGRSYVIKRSCIVNGSMNHLLYSNEGCANNSTATST